MALSLLPAKDAELIGYDWSGHFGYVNCQGSLMWNRDWHSGPYFFDGTWANNPGLLGSEIKDGFLHGHEDTVHYDSSVVASYFDYVQGDYLQDEFSTAVDYSGNGRHIRLHGFKRSFAGKYNQYTPPNRLPQPIHQTYTIQYQSKKELEKIDVAEKIDASGKVEDNLNKDIVAAKVEENLRMGGKIVRTPIATKPLRKMPVEKTNTKEYSTEVINPTKVVGKTVREPIASKPLRKIPTEINVANEKSNDSKDNNVKESVTKTKENKTNAADKASKTERTPIGSKLLQKVPVGNSANEINKKDVKLTTNIAVVKEQDASKFVGKMPRLPIVTKPLRKENSSVVNNDIGDKKSEPFTEVKTNKEDVKVTQTPIISKVLRKNNGSSVGASNNEPKYINWSMVST